MRSALDVAKYFIKQGLDNTPDTYDGNMKLQKLLVFADLVSLALHNELLFEDDILAFENGCVVESIRLRYRNDYSMLLRDSNAYDPNFTTKEYETLHKTIGLFGHLDARELSELHHGFEFWKAAYSRSGGEAGFKHKSRSVITKSDMQAETVKILDALNAVQDTALEKLHSEVVNGVSFYYDPSEIKLDDGVLDYLDKFSRKADEKAYSIYYDDGELVVF